MSLAETLSEFTGQSPNSAYKGGIVLAQVTNINDPDSLGRVRCRPITQDNDVAETDWCHCMTPAGGNGYGVFFFPNVDDLVILAYINGEVHHPIVLGRFWADETAAPYAIDSGKNEVCSIKTPTGIEIKFDDVADKQKLTLTTPSGSVLGIDDEGKTLTFGDGNGDNALTMDLGGGEVVLKAKTKLTLSAGDTTIVLESSGAITITSNNSVDVKTTNIGLAAKSEFKADGATVAVSATGQMDLKASGVTNVKGSLLNLN